MWSHKESSERNIDVESATRDDPNKDLNEWLMEPEDDHLVHSSYVCGIIDTSLMSWLKLMMFRVTRGNVLVMSKAVEDEKSEKTMFVVVAISPEIEARLTRICEGFADLYEVIQESTDLKEM